MLSVSHGHPEWFLSRPSHKAAILGGCVFHVYLKEVPWRRLGASPHSLELWPLLPLLTAQNLLRDAGGNGYRIQSPTEFSLLLPILKTNLYRVFGSHPLIAQR